MVTDTTNSHNDESGKETPKRGSNFWAFPLADPSKGARARYHFGTLIERPTTHVPSWSSTATVARNPRPSWRLHDISIEGN